MIVYSSSMKLQVVKAAAQQLLTNGGMNRCILCDTIFNMDTL